MKKILVIFCLLTSLNISAQQIGGGLIGGLSASQIDGDTQKDYKKLGVYSGVFVETDFTKVIGAKIELYYIIKGAKKMINDIEEFNTTLHYIEMPFLVTIKPVDKFQFDVGLGISYLIGSRLLNFGYEVYGGLYDMRDLDFGGMVSGSYFFTEKIGINVRIEYSLMSVKNDKPNWYNSNLSFGLVYKIL